MLPRLSVRQKSKATLSPAGANVQEHLTLRALQSTILLSCAERQALQRYDLALGSAELIDLSYLSIEC